MMFYSIALKQRSLASVWLSCFAPKSEKKQLLLPKMVLRIWPKTVQVLSTIQTQLRFR